MMTWQERFWAKVEKTDTCWLWTARCNWRGYGQTRIDRRTHLAHRVAYELLVAHIPAGLTLDHLCRNRACVNPAHLEPVTLRENILRGTSPSSLNARKTRCPRGHVYDGTRMDKGRPSRLCRRCRLENQRRQRARKAAA